MSQFPRPLLMERQYDEEDLLLGGCLIGVHFVRFMALDPRDKLLLIRIWLEDMYGDEFSRPSVIKRIRDGMTYQGLKNIEESLRNKVREDNVTRIVDVYGISEDLINKQNAEECGAKGLFVGKPEHKQEYFLHYYNQHGKNHLLDVTDYSKMDWEEHTNGLDEVEVEVFLKINDPNTGERMAVRNIAKLKLMADDLPNLHDIIAKDIDLVSDKHTKFMNMREEIQELYQRLASSERNRSSRRR